MNQPRTTHHDRSMVAQLGGWFLTIVAGSLFGAVLAVCYWIGASR